MTDTMSPKERSRRMGLVRSVDTKPEMTLRRLVHGMGYRYRLHGGDLPGKPDLVFRSRHAVIFVHGCFWHRHEGCPLARLPKTRVDFWTAKLEGNRKRDMREIAELKKAGWRVFVVWECELKNMETLARRLRRFLDRGKTNEVR
jgi:DNA mismatch endonuclease (patch repair protein)